ncbi:hypothetical protein GH714_043245 [Hevea brasiliensis]|uniref:Uncharacterized protein n=1 Tax=Hevea brasiliensis TaxID=3981 RepID=A0A6A6K417_HEVBR|nr:hypothetical protein GH714_043245 [Hevea brasiliensis]
MPPKVLSLSLDLCSRDFVSLKTGPVGVFAMFKVEDGAVKTGVPDVPQEKPVAHFQILDSAEIMDKYRKYEADYTHRLMAKYFSKKNLYGVYAQLACLQFLNLIWIDYPFIGDVFDERLRMGDETIMSSRWPSTQSFADPVKGFEEQGNVGSTSEG